MFEAFILSVLETLKGFGYFGILFALCFEFVPAEIVLPLAGFWVAEGDFHYALTVLAGSVGGTIGPITLYALGKYGGRPMVIKYGKYFLIQEKQIRAADRFFEKYGASVAFFARFFPVVRKAVSVPCGVARMSFWKFTLYTFLAMLPITALYVYLGKKLGENWQSAGALFAAYTEPILIVLGIGLLLYIIYLFWKRRS